MPFRYEYKDIDCSNCLDLVSIESCPHQLCPYIITHLNALAHDPAFHAAIADAQNCGTFHRATLLQLQEAGLPCRA
ncbi:MAG: hypothetical protein FWE28_00590 [Oscillospiraceae bacterium]|nr:hypothetical protein [Oscillospiraceae bacterium]